MGAYLCIGQLKIQLAIVGLRPSFRLTCPDFLHGASTNTRVCGFHLGQPRELAKSSKLDRKSGVRFR
jgi:hypothetical protein